MRRDTHIDSGQWRADSQTSRRDLTQIKVSGEIQCLYSPHINLCGEN